MDQQELITTLIKDHLVNTRLIQGLHSLGFYSEDYHLHLSDLIFKLIGISDEKEELYEVYLNWCTKISQTDIWKDQKLLHDYAEEIYAVLLGEVDS